LVEYQANRISHLTRIYTEKVFYRQGASYHNITRSSENERFTLPVITSSQQYIDVVFPVDLLFSVDQMPIGNLTASRTRKFQKIFAGHFDRSVRQRG